MSEKTRIYEIVIEPTSTGYSAYVPDIDGCVSTGATVEEVAANLREAIEFHLEGLAEQGISAPEPTQRFVSQAEQQSESAKSSQQLEVSVVA